MDCWITLMQHVSRNPERVKTDDAGDQMEQGWSRERQRVTRVAASQTKWMLERVSARVTQQKAQPKAAIERRGLHWDQAWERSGRPGYVVVQTAGSHAHVAPVLDSLQEINNKRGFEEAREEMHVLGELLGWRREWLAGACGWNESERESSKGRPEICARTTARRDKESALMVLLLRGCFVKARDESRTRRATDGVFGNVGGEAILC